MRVSASPPALTLAGTQAHLAAARVRHRALLLVTCIVTLIYGLVVAGTVAPYGGNLSALVQFGDQSPEVQPGGLGHHVVVLRHSAGYDGQSYYYVADDPFLQHRTFRDPFRYQRIGYPLAAWAVSLGRRDLRPLALLLVNLGAVAAVAYVSGLLVFLLRPGASPWWALLCAVNPSLLIGVARDLTEPLSMALSLLGLYLWLRRRTGWTALAFAAALLTRELAILFILPLIGADLLGRRWRPAALLSLSFDPYTMWQGILAWRLGHTGIEYFRAQAGAPFSGIGAVVAALRHPLPGGPPVYEAQHIMLVAVFTLAVTIATGAMIAHAITGRRPMSVLSVTLLLHGLAAIAGGTAIWIGYYSAVRVYGGLFPLVVFLYLQRATVARLALVVGSIALTALALITWVPPLAPPYTVTP